MHQTQNTHHIPVLLEAVLQYLSPQSGESYLDLTAGYGGHASEILKSTLAPDKTVLVDRDQQAIDQLNSRFAGSGVEIVHRDFLGASRQFVAAGHKFDMILADLGVSSPHLNTASRGFSIKLEGPLDMRMDRTQELTADTIVNSYDQKLLAEILRKYGEEPKANKIAGLIVSNRPIRDTASLANIIAQSAGWRHPGKSKIHPATRSFQAIRIAVNDELMQLEQALPLWCQLLSPGGRLAVISFHSLEDRIVKQFFASRAGNRYDAELRALTSKPVTGSENEIVSNPRARSAKLRAVVKINNKERGD